MTHALVLTGLAKRFGEKTVFRDLSASFEAGTVQLVVGKNGAGKSTLLKMIAGAESVDEGTLACAAPPEARAYIGHHTFLYPGLSALENLAFWAGWSGRERDEEALLLALDRFGLAKAAFEPVKNFSRGMAQRLNLARVFPNNPDLILLDEPATGLDAQAKRLLDAEITAAKGRGALVLWVSHDAVRDLPLADGVLSFEAGRRATVRAPKDFSAVCALEPGDREC